MENTSYLLVYLSFLLVLLGIAAFFVVRQVFKTRRIESTLSRLQKKLTSQKGTAQEYYELGSLLLDKKLFAQASLYLQQALKTQDKEDQAEEASEAENTALIYNALGYAYFAQEQFDLAIKQYRMALKAQPGYVTALNNLGHSYEKKQQIKQALEVYDEALQIDAGNGTAKRRAEALRKRVPATSK